MSGSGKPARGIFGPRILWTKPDGLPRFSDEFAGHEAQALHRGAAQIGIDPGAEGAAFMLKKKGRGGLGLQGQHAARNTV